MFAFGSLTFDPVAGALIRNHKPVPVSPRMAAVLTVLLTRHGTLVTYEDLRASAWPRGAAGSAASDVEITHYVTLVRDALGDALAETCIATVPGQGFRFVAPVTARVVATPTPLPGAAPDAKPAAKSSRASRTSSGSRTRKTAPRKKPSTETAQPPAAAGKARPTPKATEPDREEATTAKVESAAPEPLVVRAEPPASPAPEVVPLPAAATDRRALVPVLLGAALLTVIAIFGVRAFLTPAEPTTEEPVPILVPIREVLVVPFTTRQPADATLGPVMADGLVQRLRPVLLARVARQVVPVPGERLAAIGERLGVDAVVGGSIERQGNVLRVSAELVRVSDGQRLSSMVTESDEASLFDLQNQVARHLAQAVRADLPSDADRHLSPSNSPLLTAYLSLERAHTRWLSGDPASHLEAIRLYTTATEQDASFGRAFAELAIAYGMLGARSDPLVNQPHAVAAAERAVALDATSPLAQAALGLVRARFQWRWTEAEQAFDAAVALDPKDAHPFVLRAWYLSTQGRHDEAVADLRRALEFEPDSPLIRTALTKALLSTGQIAEARALLDTLADQLPAWPLLEHLEADVASAEGQESESLAHWWRALLADGVPQGRVDALRSEFRAHGLVAMQTRWATQLTREVEEGPTPPRSFRLATELALAHAALGHRDETLSWLSVALDLHEDAPLLMLSGPFDAVRDSPRFAELLERAGLPRR